MIESQRNQIKRQQAQQALQKRLAERVGTPHPQRSSTVFYRGRDPDSGRDLVERDGQITPVTVTGNAQPVLGMAMLILDTDSSDLPLVLGPSVAIPKARLATFAQEAYAISLIFVKDDGIATTIAHSVDGGITFNGSTSWAGSIEGEAYDGSLSSLPRKVVTKAPAIQTGANTYQANGQKVSTGTVLNLGIDVIVPVKNLAGASPGGSYSVSGQINYNQSVPMSSSPDAGTIELSSPTDVDSSSVGDLTGEASFSMGFSLSVSLPQQLSGNLSLTFFLGVGPEDTSVEDFDADWTFSSTWNLVRGGDNELWIGGDRPAQFLGFLDSSSIFFYYFYLVSFKSKSVVFVSKRDPEGVYIDAVYYQITSAGIVSNTYVPPEEIVVDADDWRKSTAVFSDPPPADTNPCFQNDRFRTNVNHQNGVRYQLNNFQDIDGQLLEDRLLALEEVSGAQINSESTTASPTQCTLGAATTVRSANIQPIEDVQEGGIVAYSAYRSR